MKRHGLKYLMDPSYGMSFMGFVARSDSGLTKASRGLSGSKAESARGALIVSAKDLAPGLE